MKRINDLYGEICSIENLVLADKKARLGKSKQKEIIIHDKYRENNILKLHKLLVNKEYKTSKYYIFKIFENKERIIYKLPYYPDRIVHHAIMNILESIFVKCFIVTTFNCIKKRGIKAAYNAITKALLDKENTTYCLKLDINKFYPSINNEILKDLLRSKFKDKDLLYLLDEIIDSTTGVPIGNYLSQYFANFYLNRFDHWIKEKLKIKYYFRYCDDIVIFHKDKEYLHKLLREIEEYLYKNLKLKVKSNWQVFPVESRGVDVLGFRFYHKYILLRDSIKKRFIKMMKYNRNIKSIASYNGWLSLCNSKNLKRKYYD